MNSIVLKTLRYNIIEHMLFIVLGVSAFLLFEERLYADSGYYIFKVINTEFFRVECDRYVIIFSQLIPLAGIKIGLSLKTILCMYSVGHIIFFYIIFLISRYGYQNKQSGLLLLLIQTLGISSGFFVPMFELYYGAGLLVLFATILYRSTNKNNYLILCFLLLLILTSHPYATVLVAFLLALHAETFKLKYFKHYLLFLTLWIGVFVYKKYNLSEYEQAKTNAFIANLQYAEYNVNYIKSLFSFLSEHYKALMLIEFVVIVVLVASKDYVKSALIGMGFIGAVAMVNVSNYGFEATRYQEQVYFPLTFLAAYPFAIFLLKNKSDNLRLVFYCLAVAIICVRINGIWSESEKFSRRVDEIKLNIEHARTLSGSKFVVPESSLKYASNWSYPIESMLLSSYSKIPKTITICTDQDFNFNQNNEKLVSYEYLFRRWEIYSVESLNKKYFKLDSLKYFEFEKENSE